MCCYGHSLSVGDLSSPCISVLHRRGTVDEASSMLTIDRGWKNTQSIKIDFRFHEPEALADFLHVERTRLAPFEVACFCVFWSFNRCFPWLIRARAPARNRDRETPFDYEHEHHPLTRIEHEHVKKTT
jgi:hypothetical protein